MNLEAVAQGTSRRDAAPAPTATAGLTLRPDCTLPPAHMDVLIPPTRKMQEWSREEGAHSGHKRLLF